MTTPANQSVWTRPLSTRFSIWVGGLCLATVIGIVTYPYTSSTLVWLGSRTVSYRGSVIPLPFRWIDDSQGTPLTIEKPSWTWGVANELAIEETNLDVSDQQKRLERWATLQRTVHPQYPTGTAPDAFTETNGRSLLCFEDVTQRFITMHCLSQDAEWTFHYFGSAKEAHNINSTVQELLAPEGDRP
jgi:hypothetical protein